MSAQALLLELEPPVPVPVPPSAAAPPSPSQHKLERWHWNAKAAALMVMVLYFLLLAMGRGPPASIVLSGRLAHHRSLPGVGGPPASIVEASFPRSTHHRSLRGAGGVYPVTSPTNGGQLVSPGVPWAPSSIADAQTKFPTNAKRMVANALVGQKKQDNKLEDDVYSHIRVYARLQDRAEDQVLVARLQDGLGSPTYVRLRQRVSDPNYQYSLQAGMYRRGPKYQQMMDRVSDPAYLADLQARLYRGALRPGPPHHIQYSDQPTAVESFPRPFLPSHVP